MRTLPQLKTPLVQLLAFAVSVLLVFWWHRSFLAQPFYADDFGFLRKPVHRYSGSGVPTHLGDWFEVWNPGHGWFYRPTYLTYWMVMHVLGLTNAPFMHGVGLFVHALNAFLWAALVVRLSRHLWWGVATWAIFILWPGKDEAISWISSHSTLFAVAGLVIAGHCWLSFREGRGRSWYFAALLAFGLGCCSKNDAAVGIVLFPLIDRFFEREKLRIHLAVYVPLLAGWAIYLVFEWHGARLYGTRGDGVYDIMAHIPFWQRFRFVLSWFNSFTHSIPPIYPFGPMTLLLVPFSLCCRRVWFFWRARLNARESSTFWMALWFSLAASIPVPFVSCFHAMGSRFLYFPAMPFSTLAVLCFGAGIGAASQWRKCDIETSLSIGGLALAACAILVIWRPSWELGDPALSAMLHLGVLGLLFVLWRSKILDGRLAALLAVSLLARDASIYFPFASLDVWPCIACLVGVCIWRQDMAGALFVFAAWINFPVVVLLLIARVVGVAYRSHPKISAFWGSPNLKRQYPASL